MIQTQSENYSGGTDIGTMQYDFSGKLLRTHLEQHKSDGIGHQLELATKNSYDDLGRAITDPFLLKSLVTGVGRLVATTLYKSAAEQITKINTERITWATFRKLTRESLIETVTNPQLKKVVENLYRPGAKIGSGSTTDLIRLAPDAGHIEKGGNYITGIRNLINSGSLSGQDLNIVNELMSNLIEATSTLK